MRAGFQVGLPSFHSRGISQHWASTGSPHLPGTWCFRGKPRGHQGHALAFTLARHKPP